MSEEAAAGEVVCAVCGRRGARDPRTKGLPPGWVSLIAGVVHGPACPTCWEPAHPGVRVRLKRLAPGVYDDGAGGLHLVVAELLVAHGYGDTEENRARIIDAATEIFGADLEVTE